MTPTHPLRGMRALVSGAGVAGPAVAYWLAHFGAETTVVEIAPALRTSGFAVDFRGPTHLGVLERMGVLDELRRLQTHAGAMRGVDEHDRTIFELPAAFAGGEVEVLRRDLSRVLHDRSAPTVDYLFDNSITAMTDTADGVRVEFSAAPSRTVDVVIGADGMHSGVRRLAFGPEADFVRRSGYYLAGWSMPNDMGVGSTPLQYNVPGRMASIVADGRDPARAIALCVFSAPPLEYGWNDTNRQKELVTTAFAGMGWRVPQLLTGLAAADELYFDSICRVGMKGWTKGRVALLGDAGFGVTLGGMGVGTGIVGAYVLAGELAVAGGDHRVAFSSYERRMRPLAGRWQRGASPGQFLAPRTAAGLWVRNRLFGSKAVQRAMVAGTTKIATDERLPDYPAVIASRSAAMPGR